MIISVEWKYIDFVNGKMSLAHSSMVKHVLLDIISHLLIHYQYNVRIKPIMTAL